MVCMHGGQGCAITTRMLLPRVALRRGRRHAARPRSRRSRTATRPTPATSWARSSTPAQRDARARLHREGQGRGRAAASSAAAARDQFDKGYFVEPTLFVDVDPDSTIAQEEIFGPVLARHQVRRTTTTPCASPTTRAYGLSGAVASSVARPRARRRRSRIRTGTVSVNGGVWFGPDSPFGGYKESGIGREHGVAGLRGVPRDQDDRAARARLIGASASRHLSLLVGRREVNVRPRTVAPSRNHPRCVQVRAATVPMHRA